MANAFYNEIDHVPANLEAEKVLIGAVLIDNAYHVEAAEKLAADDFFLDSHRRIFLRMTGMLNAGRPVDIVTLSAELDRHSERDAVGGTAYLAGLTEGLPRRPVIGAYIEIVKDKSVLRRVMQATGRAYQNAQDGARPALDILSDAIRDLEDVSMNGQQNADLESVGQWLDQNDVFAKRVPGIYTGIDEYDEMTYGLHPGELTVVAARTSVGKTAHAGTLSWQISTRGKSVAVFLNEQAKASFIGRMLCGAASVPFENYRRDRLDWAEKQYIDDTVARFRTLPLYIDQRSSMSVASIKAKSARLKRNGELDLILVDQLSRVSRDGLYEKGMRTDEVIGEKVSALKAVAVALQVPLLLYHQLGRASVKNQDARPTLVDLAESGKIEQHADNVLLLHRPGYFNRDDPELKDKGELILSKQRDGPTGTVHCEFISEFCLWRNRKEKR